MLCSHCTRLLQLTGGSADPWDSRSVFPWLEQARFDEMPTWWYGAVDVDVVRSEHYRLCDERESMTAQLYETHRRPSGTLFAAGQGWEPPSTAAYPHSYFAGRPRVCRGPPGRPLPRTSMDVYNTGQSLVAHSITCCVQPNTVPKRPGTLAPMPGTRWSRIAKMKGVLCVWPPGTAA